MTENNTSITKPTKPPIGLKRGIGASRAAFIETMKNIDPKTAPNRIGIVLDDSGSMGTKGMDNVHKAVKGFTNSCNMTDTSIAVYPMNATTQTLTCDYDILNAYVCGIGSTGGTPMYTTLDKIIKKEDITRAVVFSDGVPTDSTCLVEEKETNDDFYYGKKDSRIALEIIMTYNKEVVPIDTIFIGMEDTQSYREMKQLAKMAKGEFIHFKDISSLSTGLKYLSPKFRYLLANPEIKARIEKGENV